MNDYDSKELRKYIENSRLNSAGIVIPQQSLDDGCILDDDDDLSEEEEEDEEDFEVAAAAAEQPDFYDPQFEAELELFKLKLDQAKRTTPPGQRRRKLVPNVSSGWIDQLRLRLQKNYNSPRGVGTTVIKDTAQEAGNNKQSDMKQQVPNNSRVKYNQRSA